MLVILGLVLSCHLSLGKDLGHAWDVEEAEGARTPDTPDLEANKASFEDLETLASIADVIVVKVVLVVELGTTVPAAKDAAVDS